MAETCISLGNTGSVSCPFLMKAIARIILVPKLASDGTENKISSGSLTKATLQALFDNANKLDRFYPTPVLKNVTDERADPVFQEWEGGGKAFIQDGVRTFTGMIPKGTPELAGRLKQWNGQDMGFFAFDMDGNFIYNDPGDGSGDYKPIPIDGDSFDTGFKKSTYSEVAVLLLQFDVKQKAKDSDIRYVSYESLDFDGLSTADVYGLSEVAVKITAATSTSGTFTANLDMGTALSGLAVTDVVVTNVTDGATITLTSLTESGTNPGTYTWANSTGASTGDSIRVAISKSKLSHSYDTFVATA